MASAKYEVFESPMSDNVIFTTRSKKEFLDYCEKNKIVADQCAINDLIILGFDEV